MGTVPKRRNIGPIWRAQDLRQGARTGDPGVGPGFNSISPQLARASPLPVAAWSRAHRATCRITGRRSRAMALCRQAVQRNSKKPEDWVGSFGEDRAPSIHGATSISIQSIRTQRSRNVYVVCRESPALGPAEGPGFSSTSPHVRRLPRPLRIDEATQTCGDFFRLDSGLQCERDSEHGFGKAARHGLSAGHPAASSDIHGMGGRLLAFPSRFPLNLAEVQTDFLCGAVGERSVGLRVAMWPVAGLITTRN